MRYRITTPYGDIYECTEAGNVTRSGDNTWPETHDSWRFIGVSSTHPFSFGRIIMSLADLASHSQSFLRYKNGSPKFTLVDLDHGTRRVHGNTKYHGIASISIIGDLPCPTT
jgi:hypothetical protein